MNLGHSNSAEYDNHNAVCPQYLQYLSAGKDGIGGQFEAACGQSPRNTGTNDNEDEVDNVDDEEDNDDEGRQISAACAPNHHHHHHHHHRSQSSRCSTISENLAPSPFTSYSDHQAQHHLIHPALHSTTIEGKAQYIQYIQYYN